MCQVDINKVQSILPIGNQLTDSQLNIAIDAAICTMAKAARCLEGYSEDCQSTIAAYLAAHYAAMSDHALAVKSETDPCCGSAITYGFEFGTGLNGTPYGQAAITMSGGCLADIDKPKARLYSIGCI